MRGGTGEGNWDFFIWFLGVLCFGWWYCYYEKCDANLSCLRDETFHAEDGCGLIQCWGFFSASSNGGFGCSREMFQKWFGMYEVVQCGAVLPHGKDQLSNWIGFILSIDNYHKLKKIIKSITENDHKTGVDFLLKVLIVLTSLRFSIKDEEKLS